MGKQKHAWLIGLTAVALASPWAVSSTPLERLPPSRHEIERFELPGVRLEFAEQTVDTPAAVGRPPIEPARLPAEIPGGDAAATPLPKFDPSDPKSSSEAIARLFPPLPPAGVVMPFVAGPEGRPIRLDDLQRYAEANSPVLRQAAIDATTTSPRSFCNLDTLILARQRNAKAVAESERELARLAMVEVDAEIRASVRRGYFAVLAAQEAMRVHEAFGKFTEDAYTLQVEAARLGKVPASEPLALRALAYQSRVQIVQARNRYLSSWKQLAATVGRFDMQPVLLDGRIDAPLPLIDYVAAFDCMMSRNVELATAQQAIAVARSKDQHSTLMPFLAFNRASITRAHADLARAEQESARVQTSLAVRLADAYERYDTQRRVIVYYRDHIIPDQARAYRAAAARPGPDRTDIGEVVAAEQALAASVGTYLQALGDAWFAVVDIGQLTQTPDIFTIGDDACGVQLTCLRDMPSCRVGAGALSWPEVMPTFDEPPQSRTPRVVLSPAQPPSMLPAPCTMSPCQPREMTLEPPPTTPRAEPRPVSNSALVAPFTNIEKSTKRRRFFTWPTKRGDEGVPLVLPFEDPAPCCPPVELPSGLPAVIPKNLPQVRDDFHPILPLPEVVVKTTEPTGVALPKIVEGPLVPTPADHPGAQTIVIGKDKDAFVPNRLPDMSSVPLPLIVNGPASPTIRKTPPAPPAPTARRERETPATAAPTTIARDSFERLSPAPEAPRAPVVEIPPLRLPPLR